MINRKKLTELIRNYPCMSTASADELLDSIAEDLADDLADQVSAWFKPDYPVWLSVENTLPPEDKPVLVTYLGYKDKKPYADMFAYMHDSKWYWLDTDEYGLSDVRVEITHWCLGPNPADSAKDEDVTVIVPPCKIGDTVWFRRRPDEEYIETKVEKIIQKSTGLYLELECNKMYETSCNSIGKTVFFKKPKLKK